MQENRVRRRILQSYCKGKGRQKREGRRAGDGKVRASRVQKSTGGRRRKRATRTKTTVKRTLEMCDVTASLCKNPTRQVVEGKLGIIMGVIRRFFFFGVFGSVVRLNKYNENFKGNYFKIGKNRGGNNVKKKERNGSEEVSLHKKIK